MPSRKTRRPGSQMSSTGWPFNREFRGETSKVQRRTAPPVSVPDPFRPGRETTSISGTQPRKSPAAGNAPFAHPTHTRTHIRTVDNDDNEARSPVFSRNVRLNRTAIAAVDRRTHVLDRPKNQKANSSGIGSLRHRHPSVDAAFSAAAIDDVVSRGLWRDWVELRQAAIEDPSLLDVIERVCRAFADDPYARRHHFWLPHVPRRRRTS